MRPLTRHNGYMNAKNITQKLITDTPMSLPEAILYGVDMNGGTVELGRHRDIYDLLDMDWSENAKRDNLVGIAIHTTGWAAPLNADGGVDGAPSQHPDRVRVALVATISTVFGTCSGIAFADGRETQYEDNAPEGSLWEAMNRCLENIK